MQTPDSVDHDLASFPSLLKRWRTARRYSQLELAHEAEVSARHVSFLETGRARPSPTMVERLATALEVPLRERNSLLLAAGFAPRYPDRPLAHPSLSPVQRGVQFLLDSHNPYPAFALDRLWNVLLSNSGHRRLLRLILGREETEVNILRLVTAPGRLRDSIRNWPTVVNYLHRRMERHLSTPSTATALAELHQEMLSYPGVREAIASEPHIEPESVLVPVVFEVEGHELSFFTTLASFGAAVEVSLEEIVIESLHPMDEATAKALRRLLDASN